MKRLALAAFVATFVSAPTVSAQTLIEASTTAEVAALVAARPDERAVLVRSAVGLGVADPVELIFALVSPDTESAASEEIAMALTMAAPRRADEVAAASAIAADILADEARLLGLIDALMTALAAALTDDVERAAEVREVLAALLSVTDPSLRLVLANALADGDGETLLAALGEGPETAAIDLPPRPFGEGPSDLTLTPGSAAQDAPSAN